MTLAWDYAGVASDYDARPGYAEAALAACFDVVGPGAHACDVGAGTGRLTAALVARALRVVAVEPSAAMRRYGRTNVAGPRVVWVSGRAEALPLRTASSELVAFGSSFNVVERATALAEAARVLVPGGRLVCLWNHRDLADPLQRRIEDVIRSRVPRYDYGSRREPQDAVIAADGRFGPVECFAVTSVQRTEVVRWMAAWRSHLTLRRQAGARFAEVVAAIADVLAAERAALLEIPYVTRCWIATRR